MKKPKLYISELLRKNFIEKSNTLQIMNYLKHLNEYIEYLQSHTDLEETEEETNVNEGDLE
jgi:hypothetical protein